LVVYIDEARSVSFAEKSSDEGPVERPLCVDLDGALVRGDVLWEALALFLRKRPWLILVAPFWLMRGRESLEREVLRRTTVDPASLPYRAELVERLREDAAKGRRLVLLSTAGEPVAKAVADHLGLFDDVVANEPRSSAVERRRALEARFGALGFDYISASLADLALTTGASRGFLVGASRRAQAQVKDLGGRVEVMSPRRSRLAALVKLMRPHQWAKNALVVMPVLLARTRPTPAQIIAALLAAATFSLCASAGYLFNDLLDVEADRAHRTKRLRPFASGDVPLAYGPPAFLALFVVSFGVAYAALPLGFMAMLALYFVATLTYSFSLKSKLLLDVVVLAWLYTHRVLAGGIATGIPIGAWLLAFSMFMFSSLAFAKRYIELRQATAESGQLKNRDYHKQDMEMVASMGPAAGYIAVLVFCLYVDSTAVTEIYRAPVILWFIAPVLLYWISRVWFLAHRGQMQDDPVKFALVDRTSWVCGLIITGVAGCARVWPY
jgi:4-hydroxybenzoate polyprenyltransferase